MINLDWRQLTSEEVLEHDFNLSDDPRNHVPITFPVPKNATIQTIVHHYKYDAEKLPCARCGIAKHYEGAIVLLESGQFSLMGNCCGKKLFGDKWNIAQNEFANKRKFASLKKRVIEIGLRIPSLLNDTARMRPIVKNFDKQRHSLFFFFGENWDIIQKHLNAHDNRLVYQERISSDYRDELRAKGQYQQSVSEFQEIVVGSMLGSDLFRRVAMLNHFEKCLDLLRDIQARCESHEDKIRRLSLILEKFDDFKKELVALFRQIQNSYSFFSTKNYQTISDWFSRNPDLNSQIWFERGELFTTSNDELKAVEKTLEDSDYLLIDNFVEGL